PSHLESLGRINQQSWDSSLESLRRSRPIPLAAGTFIDMSLQGARTEHIGRHDDRGLSLLDPLNLLDLLQNEIGECGQVRNLDKGGCGYNPYSYPPPSSRTITVEQGRSNDQSGWT